MKRHIPLFAAIFMAFTRSFACAQEQEARLQQPPAHIVIDGDLNDWGDSLRYYNADKKIKFSLANSRDTLYMAVRINDYAEQMQILNAGLTLSIDTRGKKKDTYSITYPLNASGRMVHIGMRRQDNGGLTPEDRDELTEDKLTTLRQIKVTGFKDIEDDMITTSNTYGIRVDFDFDHDGYLVYEAAIPLRFFHDDDLFKNEWAFNFKINGLTRPSENHEGGGEQGPGGGRGGRGGFGGGGMGGGRGGMHGGGGRGMRGGSEGEGQQPGERSALSKPVDFWEKFYLAN